MLLVVTERFDPHVDHVLPELERRSMAYVRLHLEDVPTAVRITNLIEDNGDRGFLRIRGRNVDLRSLAAIWYRRSAPFELPESLDEEERAAADAECRSHVRGLWRTLEHVTWVSHPDSIRAAGSKAEQLLRANRLGFSVPRSCFSNDPEEVAAFCERLGGPQRVIYKPYNPMMFNLPQTTRLGVVYATPLDESDLSRLDEVRLCPGIFQERIEKRRDIRVTIFGDRAIAVAIDSQGIPATREDWRAYRWDVDADFPPHLPFRLDAELEELCVELVGSYGLRFGAIDLVEARDGKIVFLELNPNGQWAWIEQRTGSRWPGRSSTCSQTTVNA